VDRAYNDTVALSLPAALRAAHSGVGERGERGGVGTVDGVVVARARWYAVPDGSGGVPAPRAGHSALGIGSCLFVFGGSSVDGKLSAESFILDSHFHFFPDDGETAPDLPADAPPVPPTPSSSMLHSVRVTEQPIAIDSTAMLLDALHDGARSSLTPSSSSSSSSSSSAASAAPASLFAPGQAPTYPVGLPWLRDVAGGTVVGSPALQPLSAGPAASKADAAAQLRVGADGIRAGSVSLAGAQASGASNAATALRAIEEALEAVAKL
jgi:hypothetical protein